MRLIVTGTEGQVARALIERGAQLPGFSVVAIGRPVLNLENSASILPALANVRPDLIVNAAAYTAVDRAEKEQRLAFAINRDGAAEVARAAQILGVRLIHLSTGYVFSGAKEGAYVESDEAEPLGVYGKSKLAGELAVRNANPEALILRTSWVYSPFGSNFVKTMLRLAGDNSQVRVVDDQVGNPTSALELANTILSLATLDHFGRGDLFHVAGSGSTTWFGLANHVFNTSRLMNGPASEVLPIFTSEYSTTARRPANSRLDTSAFRSKFRLKLNDWHAGVEGVVGRILEGRARESYRE